MEWIFFARFDWYCGSCGRHLGGLGADEAAQRQHGDHGKQHADQHRQHPAKPKLPQQPQQRRKRKGDQDGQRQRLQDRAAEIDRRRHQGGDDEAMKVDCSRSLPVTAGPVLATARRSGGHAVT